MLELASIIILGIFAQWLAWRFKVPAILPLILIGLAVGPFAPYWMSDEFLHGDPKWLNPIHGDTGGLFPGDNLFYFVELAIGIILFEGGLTLKRNEISSIGSIVGKLITIGSAVTFIGAALAAHFIVGLSWSLSFLFSGLIIVTGPTVIAPILRNIPLKKDVANILKWEGILIDPIGALVAVLVYEFLRSTIEGGHGHGGGSFSTEAIKHFLTLALIGFSLGTIAAFALKEIIKRHWVPHYLMNVFTLAMVLLVFVGSGLLVPDSGLLTIVVFGTVLANIDLPNLEEILYFKESLAVLLISMLFILLAANINIQDLELLVNWKAALLFLSIILIIRPLGVFLSSRNSSLVLNEKLFISWVGPRGIVAAGIASLFGSKLMKLNEEALAVGEGIPFPGAEWLTPLVFMIVLGTVLLNATTASLIAKLLGVKIADSNGTLIVGASKASRLIASYMKSQNQPVALIDSNPTNIAKSNEEGLVAFQGNIYTDDIRDNIELNNMGYLMALTGSNDVNKFAINKLGANFGENGSFRIISSDEKNDTTSIPTQGLFSPTDDFINFSEVARDYPNFHEEPLNSQENYEALIDQLNAFEKCIPTFIKNKEGALRIIGSNSKLEKVLEGETLVYMGKPLQKTVA